jgi:hypothetical protein
MNIADKYHANLKYQELVKITGKKMTTIKNWFTRNNKSVLNDEQYADYIKYYKSGTLKAWRPVTHNKI